MRNIVIKTERLLLRPLTVNDADAVYEWVSDERVTCYMNYLTYTSIVQVREWLISVAEDSTTYHFGFERISDGKLIGSGDISPDGNTVYWRFGYNIHYDCWGNGYATEAAKAMMDYVRKEYGVTHFRASHAEPNIASGCVIKKCGLEFVRYGNWSKLDGSCKMRSMEYERVDV